MRSVLNKSTDGFTLIELMVTISLGAILVTVAIPSFSSFMKNGKVTTITNELVTDVNYARNEAVTRGSTIIMCRSTNPTAKIPLCNDIKKTTWTAGWIIFQSNDGNLNYNAGVDTLLKIHPGTQGAVDIITNSTLDLRLVYTADGMTDMNGETAIYAICDNRGKDHGNQLQVSPTGRPRLVSPVPVSCTSPAV